MAGSSAIIPYSSGIPVVLTTLAGGLIGTTSLVGFGDSVVGVSLVGGAIDTVSLLNLAYSMPRDGIITSVSGYLSVTAALSLLTGSAVVRAELYQSTAPDDVFTPIPGAFVDLPALTGLISIGDTISAVSPVLNIPVSAQTRILMVYSVTTTGIALATTVAGLASAGVAIS